jgi:hypothetical protein
MTWEAGQRAFFNGEIVTIERVTPSGRAVAGGQFFDPDGRQRGDRYGEPLMILTPELEARVNWTARAMRVSNDLARAIRKVETVSARAYSSWKRVAGSEEDIAKAEALLAAMRAALGAPNGGG